MDDLRIREMLGESVPIVEAEINDLYRWFDTDRKYQLKADVGTVKKLVEYVELRDRIKKLLDS